MLEWNDAGTIVPLKFRGRHSWWHLYQGREGTCAPSSVAMLLYNTGSSVLSWMNRSVMTSEVRRASKWSRWNASQKKAMRTWAEWYGKYPGLTDCEIGHLLGSYGLKIADYQTTVGSKGVTDKQLKAFINGMPVDHGGILTHDDHAMCVIRRSYGSMIFDPAQRWDEGGATWVAHGKELVSLNKSDKLCVTKNQYNSEYPVESLFLIEESSLLATAAKSTFHQLLTSYQHLTWWFYKK